MRMLVMLLLLLPNICFSAIYKCKVDGKIVYQQTPCANNEAEILQTVSQASKNTNLNAVGIRATQRLWTESP